MNRLKSILFLFLLLISCSDLSEAEVQKPNQYLTILGIAQDAGFSQADCTKENCQLYWSGDIDKRRVVSLGLTDRSTGQNWIFEATPEFIANDHMACTTDRIRLI